ncbi:hypothetical protein HDU87_000317 [Geranomyces variabilis]|uniref:Uncharacterized protein n=1 Tax=Geranomyces variabilis TaxID=109894 RepID=A0AAD5TNC3_9FUNG|nr:hypothetical protein HDU87_000317 [Geranomyces variabilis]
MRLASLSLLLAAAASLLLGVSADAVPADGAPESFPGDAFLQLLNKTPLPKFATKLILPAPSPTARRQLDLFRTAALARNLTSLLSPINAFHFPTFQKCELTKDENPVLPFTSPALEDYFTDIFTSIPKLTQRKLALSRFDLFHAHVFANTATRTAGVVFHSREYPAENDKTFPYNLGFCQVGSDEPFDDAVMRRRNLVWVMDSSTPGGSLYWIDMADKTGNADVDAVLQDGPFYTLYETDLGHVLADFYYLNGEPLGVSLY